MCLSISDIRFTTMPFKPLSDKIFFCVYRHINYLQMYLQRRDNEGNVRTEPSGFNGYVFIPENFDFRSQFDQFDQSNVNFSPFLFYTFYRLNQSGPIFLWDLASPHGRFMDDRIFKNSEICQNVF